MSNRKLAQVLQNLTREIRKLHRKLNRALVNWLLRSAFVSYGRGRSPVAGFVLPTTVLLLLVVTVAVGAMTLRAFDRNVQVIGNTQQKVIANAATPAIDRARSKLEFLFDATKDARYPGGTPFEGQLLGMMLNDGSTNQGITVPRLTVRDANNQEIDAYTLPDETRINIGGANGAAPDNAWSFRTDMNGDGTKDATVVYSVVFRTPDPAQGNVRQQLFTLTDAQKANQQIVRGAPVSQQSRLTGCGVGSGQANTLTREAWFEDASNTSIVRKSFQVDAMVIPDNPKAAATTLEFQQDRELRRGNKWGAWFRYDLEIFPAPQFNWNGAMYTEGNLIMEGSSFNAYLVSSPNSCLFQPESSELAITRRDTFRGQAVTGAVGRDPRRQGTAQVHVQNGETGYFVRTITETTDGSTAARAADVASDPVSIVLEETTRWVDPNSNAATAAAGWAKLAAINPDVDASTGLPGRIINKPENIPYVDDLYRADNRYGPKPKYDDDRNSPRRGTIDEGRIPEGMKSGDPIPTGSRLIQNQPTGGTAPSGNTTNVGLDGYWERRARLEGMRILVGQRLELGNLGGWETPRDVSGDGYIQWPSPPPSATNLINKTTTDLERPGDPLYPPTVRPYPVTGNGVLLPHLTQQRRALRDNLAAVQSAAVYHSAIGDKDYPVACLAMTSHPGTADTLRQSVNFFPTSFFQTDERGNRAAPIGMSLTNFFTGQGTNGWEFQPPAGDVATFTAQLAPNQSLRIALENLANFAGDPDGAFPPKQEAGLIHPYPALTMWGDFSNLRRALRNLDTGGYAALSVADKTYLQTASCTLGLLAYNIEQVRKFDPMDSRNDLDGLNGNGRKILTLLGLRLGELMDGNVDLNGEVLPKAQLSTYNYDPAGTFTSTTYNPRDYDGVPPEAYIAALRQQTIQNGGDYLNDPLIRMAELLMLSHQIRRDRTFGFRPSPIFGEYALAVTTGRGENASVFPAACDPDLFALNDPSTAADTYPLGGTQISGDPTSVAMRRPNGNAGVLIVKDFPNNITASTDPQQFPGAMSTGGFTSLAGARLGLSRLCGAIQVPSNYDPVNATNYAVNADGAFDPAQRPVALPKFPSLYYLFPEEEHGLRGALVERRNGNDNARNGIADRDINPQLTEYDHRQPGAIGVNGDTTGTYTTGNTNAGLYGLNVADRESYVVDDYINLNTVNGNVTFRPIPDALPGNQKDGRLQAYPSYTAVNPVSLATRAAGLPPNVAFSRYPYLGSSVFPVDDLSLAGIALQPRAMNNFPANTPAAVLPNISPRIEATNLSTNRIRIPNTNNPATIPVSRLTTLPTREWAIPFLDRVMFDGRELQPVRVTDIDVGMLRSTKPANQTAGNTTFAPNDFWLPLSGIVYAFREDAVREDAIARPPGGPANVANITNALLTPGTASDARFPANTFDSLVQPNGISVKPIDYLPDPSRRAYGFRLRNGTQIKRNPSLLGGIDPASNVRGLSLFTDQTVYIRGDFNLHQQGSGNETGRGALLEEFNEQIFPDGANLYNEAQFYGRATRNTNFANLDNDRWRSTEILADAVSILSDNFCDGSIADTFVPIPQVQNTQYNQFGLSDPGCRNTNTYSSFVNQNRPSTDPPANWAWKRETAGFVAIQGQPNAFTDFTAPVKISRTGEPLLLARPVQRTGSQPVSDPVPVAYGLGGLGQGYADVIIPRTLSDARNTRVNAIVVSGLLPSRDGQSYGGLHNFPRFLEEWGGDRLFFSGSFLQLNFSNYATGPYEQEGWEPGQPVTAAEPIPHYIPPTRLWGYDVALQFAPAGPAATRFVSPSTRRNEFYTELPVNDPYMSQLCRSAQGIVPGTARLNCPA